MNAKQRIAIVVAAIVILAGGLVLAQSASEEDGGERAAQTQPAEDPTVTAEGSGGTTAPQTTPAPPAPRVETIRMRGRAPVGEPQTLRFERGDTIRLRFVSDVAEEVHIHGYDRYVQVPAGGSARTRFRANAEGIFEVESHGSGELLAELEVRP